MVKMLDEHEELKQAVINEIPNGYNVVQTAARLKIRSDVLVSILKELECQGYDVTPITCAKLGSPVWVDPPKK